VRRWPRISASSHEVAPGRARDRLAERGFADAGRADQTQDRPLHFLDALLDREIFKDPLLDLLEPKMIGIKHPLGALDVALDLGALVPRQ